MGFFYEMLKNCTVQLLNKNSIEFTIKLFQNLFVLIVDVESGLQMKLLSKTNVLKPLFMWAIT